MKQAYSEHIKAENAEGSNKAPSYIRAMDLLEEIIARKRPRMLEGSHLWGVTSVSEVQSTYEYILEQQRLGDRGLFKGETPPSYWRDRFYSAALKSYKNFLILNDYERIQWELYRNPELSGGDLSEELTKTDVEFVDELIPEDETLPVSRVGRDAVREVKCRLDQGFFRKMILSQYQSQCCVTGLNIPEVLRASHIVAWADDERNRLNPENGLCLSATYDAAFDRHLISFDDEYRMVLSTGLRDYYTNDAFQRQFKILEGQKIILPKRFRPDMSLLESHRTKLEA